MRQIHHKNAFFYNGSSLAPSILLILQNIRYRTPQSPAQIIDRSGSDWLVMLEPVNGGAAEVVLGNQRVGTDIFLFECFPKGIVDNHRKNIVLPALFIDYAR